MPAEEITAAVLFYSNYVLAAVAAFLAVMLYLRHRSCGWLVLACAFLSPFYFLVMRKIHGQPLLTYYSAGPVVNGLATVNYNWKLPTFYAAMTIGLFLIKRDGSKKQ